MNVLTPAKTAYQFGQFEVNAASGELLKNGKRVKLQEQPFRLLVVLLENAGEVVAREELRARIWPEDTFVDFEGSLRVAVRKLRDALGDDADSPRFIETIPKRGYRFLSPAVRIDGAIPLIEASTSVSAKTAASGSSLAGVEGQSRVSRFRSSLWILPAVAALIVVAVLAWLLLHRTGRILSEKDTVVVADFSNSTGDPVFDGTLREGLAVELEQSPFLSLISDQRIQQTLALMGQPLNTPLTPQIARDLCQRTQSAAYLTGSIASLGSQYVLGLKAVSCLKGDVLAEEQEAAVSKEKILGALDHAASRLRAKLGESLKTVEKFSTPLEQATTPSLEALQAYTLGRKIQVGRDEFAAAVPFYRRAIQFDPNFAMAYAVLGSVSWNIGETVQGAEYARKAYELHAPVSEPEKFYIESTYYHFVLGDFEKAREVYDTSAQTYPRYSGTQLRLWLLDSEQGQYESALNHIRDAIQLDPSWAINYRGLVNTLIRLNRLQEAGATARQAIANGFDSSTLHLELYKLAFLQKDAQAMVRQTQSVTDNANFASWMLESEAETAAYAGHLRESRDLAQRAAESARRADEDEVATDVEANSLLESALFAQVTDVESCSQLPPTTHAAKVSLYALAMSCALAGKSAPAQSLADYLAKGFPEDTLVQFNFLPVIRAQIALNQNNPQKAIDLLRPAAPYELSDVSWDFLGPIYVRGEAYLMAHRGNEAVSEFQKIIDHRGIVANSPTGALAYLQLGRAYALSGDKNKTKSSYQEFLTLWKNADPDLADLKQARSEYAELK
jgi:eukaryotic-like serine/threonine-protein kinase